MKVIEGLAEIIITEDLMYFEETPLYGSFSAANGDELDAEDYSNYSFLIGQLSRALTEPDKYLNSSLKRLTLQLTKGMSL